MRTPYKTLAALVFLSTAVLAGCDDKKKEEVTAPKTPTEKNWDAAKEKAGDAAEKAGDAAKDAAEAAKEKSAEAAKAAAEKADEAAEAAKKKAAEAKE